MPVRTRPAGRTPFSYLSIPLLAAGIALGAPASSSDAATPKELVSVQKPLPTQAQDEASALRAARRYGKPVEVLSARSETSQTFAQPGGTLRLKQSAVPERVLRGGQWTAIDTTLRRSGGRVVPTATTLDMSFSGGGSEPMLTVAAGSRGIALSWPKALPSPILAGESETYPDVPPDTAIYPEVLPGVDLQLAAGADSFSEVLVVKTAEAAKNPELAAVRFGLAASGVELKQDPSTGFISAVDKAGEALFVSDGARMWDSPAGAAMPASKTARAAAEADAEPGLEASIPVRLATDSLTVTPSQALLTDPAASFPIYIDPGWNGGTEIWTHVSRKSPGTSFWTDKESRKHMRLGQEWRSASDDDWRTIVQFSVPSYIHNSVIKHAWVLTNVYHSADCTPSSMQLWRTNMVSKSSAVTWNNTKDKWWKRIAEVKATANKSKCPKGNDEVAFKQSSVAKEFQQVATDDYGSITLAFRAKSESDEYQWKKLMPGSTYLDIEYNHKPAAPTKLAFSPCNTTNCASPVTTYDPTPSLSMAVADADGGKLRYEYEVWDSTKKIKLVDSGNTRTGVAVNTVKPYTVPETLKLKDGQYYWKGRGCDSYGCGPLSGWYGFRVDATNPKNPLVTSDVYSPTLWKGGPAVPGKFFFKPGGGTADGVKSYTYSLNGGPAETVIAAADGTASKTLAPGKDHINVLEVTARDAANNISGGFKFKFLVRPVSEMWKWPLDEGQGIVAASTPINNAPATLASTGNSWSTVGYKGSGGSVLFSGTGELNTEAPVLATAQGEGFTVSAAVFVGAVPDMPETPEVPQTPTDPPELPTSGGDDPDSEESPEDDEQQQEPVEPALPAASQVAVAQQGLQTSLFRLGYRADLDLTADGRADPAWCFTVAGADSAEATRYSACTPEYVTAGEWVHLTGIVDRLSGTVKLYVNGTEGQLGAVASVAGRADWSAEGRFTIGRGLTAGQPADRWIGGIDEVYAVPRRWTDEDIDAAVDFS